MEHHYFLSRSLSIAPNSTSWTPFELEAQEQAAKFWDLFLWGCANSTSWLLVGYLASLLGAAVSSMGRTCYGAATSCVIAACRRAARLVRRRVPLRLLAGWQTVSLRRCVLTFLADHECEGRPLSTYDSASRCATTSSSPFL